jgi:aflatoxin B1 aldehyde reductase
MAPGIPYIFLGGGPGVVVNSTPEEVRTLLAHIQKLPVPIHGVDTAAIYPSTNRHHSENTLGKAGIAESGLTLNTKVLLLPSGSKNTDGSLSRNDIKTSIDDSLKRLKIRSVKTLYAHHPDRVTPVAETVGAFGEVLKEGKAETVSPSASSMYRFAIESPQHLKGILIKIKH